MLLEHCAAPLLSGDFASQLESYGLIEAAGRIQAPESPELDRVEVLMVAEGDGLADELAPYAAAAAAIVQDEPTQVSLIVPQILPVDGYRTDDPPVLLRGPDAVPRIVEATHELGDAGRNLALEELTESNS